MIRAILSICIIGAFGILALAIVRPELATTLTDHVLSTVTENHENAPLEIPVAQDRKPIAGVLIPSLASYFDHVSTNTKGIDTLNVQGIIDATNKERISNGLPALTPNAKLIGSSKLKVDDMVTKQYFEHVSPTGQNVSSLGTKVGYDFVIMGENLALGNFTDATDLLTAWMNSPGHRANILNTGYQEIGVYAAQGTYDGRKVWFAVQHFGTPRTACPVINASLKTSIASLNADLKKKEKVIAAARADLESPDQSSGEAYKTKVARFNTLVSEYNTLLLVSQQQVAAYNKQVLAFNKCLTAYQNDESLSKE